jgi:hypothetical protein
MKNETVQTEPRKLSKPVREEAEMKREELVAYANESGGFITSGGPMLTTFPFTT